MGQVVFLNTGYKPTEKERDLFHYLQAVTNNYKLDVKNQDGDSDWAKIRISLMVQQRRNKIRLVENDDTGKFN